MLLPDNIIIHAISIQQWAASVKKEKKNTLDEIKTAHIGLLTCFFFTQIFRRFLLRIPIKSVRK